jgi:hypothetical protein
MQIDRTAEDERLHDVTVEPLDQKHDAQHQRRPIRLRRLE